MQTLKNHIKQNTLDGVYLFCGNETYVRDMYLDIVIQKILSKADQAMNLDVFGSEVKDLDKVVQATQTMPFLAERRVVVLKNKGLGKKKEDAKAKPIADVVNHLPESTVLILVEGDVDKTSLLYKAVKKKGHIITFDPLSEGDLMKHIARTMAGFELTLTAETARFILEYVGQELWLLSGELEKLGHYKLGEKQVTIEDVKACMTKSIENKVFDLVDAIGKKEQGRALKIYHDLLVNKESPLRLLYMITRQFRINLQCLSLSHKQMKPAQIASLIKLPPFVVNKTLGQIRHFDEGQLKRALRDCLKTEMDFKQGLMKQTLALELLIVTYSAKEHKKRQV